MKSLGDIAPWKVVSVTFGLMMFLATGVSAFITIVQERLRAGMGPFGLMAMGLAFALIVATPALVVTAVQWLIKRKDPNRIDLNDPRIQAAIKKTDALMREELLRNAPKP